jgi:peptidoglycan/LPS O-acetylase OafA/YrhL
MGGRALPHQPALDGVRGAAVLAVLLFHGGKLQGGYLGVDAFFVLSGFLITSLLLAEHASSGRISLRSFWARRARRLLPALGLVLVGVAAYAAFVARPEELAEIRGDALATIGYVANWREILTDGDYWALFRAPSPLQHTWSLAIEEQFYLLWPVLVGLVVAVPRGRDAAGRVLALAISGAVASFALAQLLYDPTDTARVYYGTDTRLASILVGAALAAWAARHGPVRSAASRRVLEGIAAASVVALLAMNLTVAGTSAFLYRGGLMLSAVATAAVIAAGVQPARGPVAAVFSWRPLRGLGLVSYGVYLWHWPLYVWLDEARVGVRGWPLLGARVGVTLVVAVVSYVAVERPIRFGTVPRRAVIRVSPLAAAAVVLTVVVGTAGATRPPVSAATTGRAPVALFGDSVAASLHQGFATTDLTVADETIPACRLIRGALRIDLDIAPCQWRTTWRDAIDERRPEVAVLLAGNFDILEIRLPGTEEFVAPGDAAWHDAVVQHLTAAARVLGRDGAHVVLVTQPCVGGAPSEVVRERSSMNVEWTDAWNRALREAAASYPRAVVADLYAFLCPDGSYRRAQDGVPVVRHDGVHFTPEGARLVATWLAPTVSRLLDEP